MKPVIGSESPFMDTSEEGFTFMKFPVVLHKDADSDYGVIVPDVPGCFSAGSTVAEAFENTQEALALHYEGLVADGAPLPRVQDIDAHLDNPDYAGGIWGVVDFDITPYSASRYASTPRCPSNCWSVLIKQSGVINATVPAPDFWPQLRYANCRHDEQPVGAAAGMYVRCSRAQSRCTATDSAAAHHRSATPQGFPIPALPPVRRSPVPVA